MSTTPTPTTITRQPANSLTADFSDGHSKPVVSNNLGLLLSLQHSDSFFPSGAMAFSWGLESLMRDKLVYDADSLAEFIESQLLHRWVSFDQGVVSAAWHAADAQMKEDGNPLNTLDKIVEIDQLVDAMTLAPLMREGSRRLGLTLVNVHAKLGTASALGLQQYIAGQQHNAGIPIAVMPHLAVVQGYLWQSLGMSEVESRAVSAHTICVSATSAAVRLGLIGHLEAQRIVMRMQPLIANALAQAAPGLWSLSSNLLATDIAVMRHTWHDARLFAN